MQGAVRHPQGDVGRQDSDSRAHQCRTVLDTEQKRQIVASGISRTPQTVDNEIVASVASQAAEDQGTVQNQRISGVPGDTGVRLRNLVSNGETVQSRGRLSMEAQSTHLHAGSSFSW